jgi:hypothetical protein
VRRTLLFGFFAIVIVVTPLIIAGWFGLCPQYGDPACPGTARPIDFFPAVRAAPPALLQLFLIINLVVPYVYPLSFIGMAMVSWRSSPLATALGLASGWIGSIAWGFIAEELFVWTLMATAHQDAEIAPLLQANAANWHITVVGAGWVIGHLLAYVLLGIAFLRTAALPKSSGILVIAAAPIMGPFAYGFKQSGLQILGYLMVSAACVPAARALRARARTANA